LSGSLANTSAAGALVNKLLTSEQSALAVGERVEVEEREARRLTLADTRGGGNTSSRKGEGKKASSELHFERGV
jgi:hypothetical protein